MPFGGTDLLALGMPAGPAIGAALKAFEDWWIDSDFTSYAAAQRKKLKELAASVHS
jgi:poly(A) polymerase